MGQCEAHKTALCTAKHFGQAVKLKMGPPDEKQIRNTSIPSQGEKGGGGTAARVTEAAFLQNPIMLFYTALPKGEITLIIGNVTISQI